MRAPRCGRGCPHPWHRSDVGRQAQRALVGPGGRGSRGRTRHGCGHNTVAMQKIRAAVIGVGYLGRFHAQKYAQAPGCELVAVVDTRAEAREQVAAELSTRPLAEYRGLLGAVDAVSVVTPTPAHFLIAREFLERGAHALVEKPITESASQARG